MMPAAQDRLRHDLQVCWKPVQDPQSQVPDALLKETYIVVEEGSIEYA